VPVANAVVCASLDSTVWAVDTTDADGRAVLAVAPTHAGDLRLVVTGRNLVPFDGNIPVVPELGTAEPRLPPLTPDARFAARPSVTARAVTFSWSQPAARCIEVTDNAGRAIRTLDATDGNRLVWNGADESDHPARAGVYFCRLVDAAGRTLGSCRVLRLD
jgi:hypothetical protein